MIMSQHPSIPDASSRDYGPIRVLTGGGIGDVLLLTPGLRALRRQYPKATITVSCENRQHKMVLANNPNIDRLRCVGILDTVMYFGSKWFSASRYGKRVGYRWNAFQPHYGRLNPCTMYEPLHSTRLMAGMMGVSVAESEVKPELFLTTREKAWAARRLRDLPKPSIAVHAVSSKAIKDWPIRRWEEFIASLDRGSVIQVGSRQEPKLAGAADFRGLSIRQSFSILSQADAVVAIDSSIAHAAAAVDVPSVVIFGPSTPQIWGYRSNENVYLNYGCSPCVDLLRHDPCPFGNGCIGGITVEMVREALANVLRRAGREPRRSSSPADPGTLARC